MERKINIIILDNILDSEFKKIPRSLTGEEIGEYFYVRYVKDYVDWDRINFIVFPKYIKNVSISFVKGFTKQIFKKIYKDEFNEYFTIMGGGNIDFAHRFVRSIYF